MYSQTFKGATCEKGPVEFIHKTNEGQHITRVTANCCYLQLPLAS